MRFLLLCAALLAFGPAYAGQNVLPNGGFDAGLAGWRLAPGEPERAPVIDAGPQRGRALDLKPAGQFLGVETDRLHLGKELEKETAYEASALVKNVGLESGVFAFSMYCFDAGGKSLKQIAFYGLNADGRPHDWKRVRGEFGPGTANPLPEGTDSICIRFSFYEKSGNCKGEVMVDDVTLAKTTPAGVPGWPKEVVADVGDLQVRFESRSFWTLYRVDYQGTRLGKDVYGSHYGTVASFPGVGFIGSGHTENENEQVVSLALSVDGKAVQKPEASYRCKEIRLIKQSKIRDLGFTTTITVADNRIVEDVVMKAEQPTKLSFIYFFMHPWTDAGTDYLAELADGSRVEGAFNGDGGFRIEKPTHWSAVYVTPAGKGALISMAAVPEGRPWITRYWDKAGVYRKHYLMAFSNETVPAGQEFHYRALVVPFAAPPATWKDEAAKLAAECAKSADRR